MSTDSITAQSRQQQPTMQVTSAEFTDGETLITVKGEIEPYGIAYTSYPLKYDSTGSDGTGQGRGLVDRGTFFSRHSLEPGNLLTQIF